MSTDISWACPTKSGKRRGRPTDPRLVLLDDQLVALVAKFEPIGIRGVFYQCVPRGWLEKTAKNVKLVERRLLLLRRSGRVPYSSIVDPASDPTWYQSYGGLAEFAEAAREIYRRDYWRTAEEWPILIVEKKGLEGVIAPVTERWGIPLYPCGGQQSETLIYRVGNLIARRRRRAYVYVLSDFDAAGDCIFKTFRDGSKKAKGGIRRFTEGVPTEVIRLALTPDQVVRWELPTRPVSDEDRRSPKFIAEHGDRAVELDAIGPDRLRFIVDEAISRHMPKDDLARLKAEEEIQRDVIAGLLMHGDDR